MISRIQTHLNHLQVSPGCGWTKQDMKRLLESDPDVEEAGLSGDSGPLNAFWFEHHFFQTPDDPRVSVSFFPYSSQDLFQDS